MERVVGPCAKAGGRGTALAMAHRVSRDVEFRHIGGGAKGAFLALRYTMLIAASYLLIAQAALGPVPPRTAATIAGLLASNVALSFVPAGLLLGTWFTPAVLTIDALWVAVILHGASSGEGAYYVLYLFVLILAAVGESIVMVAIGATAASVATVWSSPHGALGAGVLLRVVFLVTVSLFHAYGIGRIRRERRRAEQEAATARVLESQVAARTAELAGLYEAAQAASRAKSDFMASMSHELRTPLHIVIGYADMLVDRATTVDGAATMGAHIRRAAAGLLHLVDEVLEVGRLEKGTIRVEPRLVDVATFADDLARREWIAPWPGVALRWDVAVRGRSMETDPAKLSIVAANLITNALKYTRAGSVAVSIRDQPDDGVVELRVADTGPGIPPDQVERMAEPFHRSSGMDGHPIAGVGLGLTIVHRYAILLGAELRVHTVTGVGTTFVVRVPHRLRRRNGEVADAA